jgi:hypothetical protein
MTRKEFLDVRSLRLDIDGNGWWFLRRVHLRQCIQWIARQRGPCELPAGLRLGGMRCHRCKQQRPFPFFDIHGTALVGFFRANCGGGRIGITRGPAAFVIV